MTDTNLLFIFITGLTTGGLTCLAVQGGLLTSVIAQQENDLTKTNKYYAIASFLAGKLLIHTALGFLLGLLGSVLTLNPVTRGWLQIFIGIYLFGIAGNLLNLHPIFRYFVITPPKFLARFSKKESQSKSVFAPALLGVMTVFIPCATTQAMEIVAIGTGNPIYAAAIMFAFVLGTSPSFLIFGFLLEKSSHLFKNYFQKIASIALFGMSIYTINSGVAVMGSVYTIQNFYQAAVHPEVLGTTGSDKPNLNNGVQEVTINVGNYGYSPANITLKKDIPVKLKLITTNVQSCSRSFTIPGLKIQKLLPQTGETIIEFTPKNNGPLAFSCSMGMYTGRFNVIN